MTKQLINLLILFSLVGFSKNVFARPRGVTLDFELRNASFVGNVVIKRYDGKGKIFFYSIEFDDTLRSANVLYFEKNSSKHPQRVNFMTGFWPYKGDTVLIVVDSLGSVSLFANRTDNKYRFWSPLGNSAVFRIYFPATPLNPNVIIEKNGEYIQCWDGCFLPINKLKEYIFSHN